MKKLTITFCLLILVKLVFAQDIITTKDGTKIKAKILETTLKEIKYKNFYDLEGPTYTLNLDDVMDFTYEEKNKAEATKPEPTNTEVAQTEVIPEPVKSEEIKPVQNNQNTNSNVKLVSNGQDVVYLKNGSIIRGIILEEVFNKSLKIQTADGNIFVYQMEEVMKITKEAMPSSTSTSQISQSNSNASGKATVYIIRQSMTGFAVPFKVTCDNNYIGTTMARKYISVVLDAGEHTIVSTAENNSELKLQIEANATYYVEQKVAMGMVMARNKLVLLDDESGKKALSKCQPAKE